MDGIGQNVRVIEEREMPKKELKDNSTTEKYNIWKIHWMGLTSDGPWWRQDQWNLTQVNRQYSNRSTKREKEKKKKG